MMTMATVGARVGRGVYDVIMMLSMERGCEVARACAALHPEAGPVPLEPPEGCYAWARRADALGVPLLDVLSVLHESELRLLAWVWGVSTRPFTGPQFTAQDRHALVEQLDAAPAGPQVSRGRCA
jgi:hypothetical protein